MLLALPAANAFAAPKARIKFQTKVSVVQENAGDGLGHVVVTRAKRLSESITVRYATSSTSATAGSACDTGVDYVSTAGSLTFAPGETSKEILVPICDDAVVEGGEFVNVALTRPATGAVVTGGGHQMAIADNDGPARLAFATTDTLIFESNGPAPLSVIRLGDPTLAVSVDYTMNDGSALAGSDYNQVNGTLNFPTIASDPVAATLRTINVGLVDDASAESEESMSVSLSNPRETVSSNPLAAGTPSVSNITILDDDIPASIAFLNPLATLGEADGGLTVTLRRTGAPDDSVSASYTTVDGTALAGSDYTSTVFDVNEPGADPLFGPNDIEVSFSVPVTDDSEFEGDEGFGLSLSNLQSSSGPVGASSQPNMNVTLTDDDPEPAPAPVAPAPPAPLTPGLVGGVLDAGAGTCGASVRAAAKQRVARRKTILVRVVTKRACTIRVRATLKYGKARSSAVRTKLVTKKLKAGQRAVVRLRLSKKAMKSVTKMLRAKRRVTAGVLVSSTSAGGRSARRTVNVRLAR